MNFVEEQIFFPQTSGVYLAQFFSPEATHFSLAKPTGVHHTQYIVMFLHQSANKLHLPQLGKPDETLDQGVYIKTEKKKWNSLLILPR